MWLRILMEEWLVSLLYVWELFRRVGREYIGYLLALIPGSLIYQVLVVFVIQVPIFSFSPSCLSVLSPLKHGHHLKGHTRGYSIVCN